MVVKMILFIRFAYESLLNLNDNLELLIKT